jgi:hypothetical protein
MRNLLAAALLAGAIAIPGSAAWAECSITLEGPNEVRFTGESGSGYDTFSRSIYETPFAMTITNLDEANPCEAVLSIQREPGRKGMIGPGHDRLLYEIAPPGDRSTIVDSETVGRPPNALPFTVGPGQTITRQLALHVLPGQSVPSGSYEETLLVRVVEKQKGFDIVAERTLRIRTYVVPQASILLYDGAIIKPTAGDIGTRNRQLDFGMLEEGETGAVTVLVQSNDGYSLRIASANRGALWHSVYGPSQPVTYRAYLNDRRLELASGEDRVAGRPATGPAGDVMRLSVQVGAVGAARAGRYEDQLTISILPDS